MVCGSTKNHFFSTISLDRPRGGKLWPLWGLVELENQLFLMLWLGGFIKGASRDQLELMANRVSTSYMKMISYYVMQDDQLFAMQLTVLRYADSLTQYQICEHHPNQFQILHHHHPLSVHHRSSY